MKKMHSRLVHATKTTAQASFDWLQECWRGMQRRKWLMVSLLICCLYILGGQPRQAAALVRKYQAVLWNKQTAGRLYDFFAAGTGIPPQNPARATDRQRRGKTQVKPLPPELAAKLAAMSPSAVTGGGDTEATATCIGALPYTDSGTTVGATDDYNLPADTTNPTMTGSCATTFAGAGPAGSLPHGAVYTGTGTGPDVVYKMSFPSGNPDTLTITVDPTSSQDMCVVVYCNTVSSNPADAIVIDDTGVGGAAETVTVGNIAPGTTLYVVVDGYSTGGTPPGPSGPYTLTVTSSGTTQPSGTCSGGGTSSDLAITKTDGITMATPGGSTTYTITASNAGPDPVASGTVTDTFPAALTCTWTCVGAGGGTCTAAGAGNINDSVNLPSGGSVTYTASCSISPSATGTLSNTATVSSAVTDPNPANNSATDTDTLSPMADLAITKTDGVTTVTPGGSTTYTITASNAGPIAVTGGTVADTFPAPLACTWTCVGAGGGMCTAAGSGNINDSVNLPSGGSVTYTASCSISPSATGTLSNTATVSSMVTDPNPANNSATDTDTLSPMADLAITKTDGVTQVTAGGATTYTITASNSGPSNAPGVTVADTFPATLTCTWTCVGAGGGTCTAAGAGNINDTANLPVGGSVTYTASCNVSSAATGSLVNTATVSTPGGLTDASPGNNSATDTDTVQLQTDLSITKTDGAATYTPAQPISYTIVVGNQGPSSASGANVADSVPAAITGVTASCVASGTASCGMNATAGNNVSFTGVNIAAGAGNFLTITVNGTVSGAATGNLVNTATVTAGGGQTDPTPGNNSATDTDTFTCPALALSPASLPVGTAGTVYNQSLAVTPNLGGPHSFAVTGGALPAGLTLSGAGVLSGTPTTTGTATFTITATGSGGFATCTATQSYSLVIACPTVTFSPLTLPNGVQGTAYSATVTAAPTGTTYSYAVTTNVLPPGLTLNPATGAITGTPTAAGNYAFSITATGWGSCTKTQSYNLLITGTCATITVNPATLPSGTLGTPYPATTVSAAGGVAPYGFAVIGALPAGLALNATTGEITGTPTVTGTFSFRITATAPGGCTGSRSYVVSVACSALTFNPSNTALPNGVAGVNYTPQAITVTPGTGYLFNVQLGSLPPGYTLSSAGVLSGVTSQTGTWTFTVRALAGGCQATKQYTLTIAGAQATALAQTADYDGDGRSDFAVWSGQGTWRLSLSNGGANRQSQTSWGQAGDVSLLGDYDGDGKTDLAVFRPANGTWFVKRSSDGSHLIKAWGVATDVPVPGDYDGDGQTDLAVFRPGDGHWYVLRSSDQQVAVTAWGAGYAPYNDVPVAGDYDGDGQTDLAVFRRATGTWYVKHSSDGQSVSKSWGLGTDTPVAADYDGDGKTDPAVWRGTSWYIWQSTTNSARMAEWGASYAPYFDQAMPGDYDGDGQTDVAIWRASDQTWYVLCSRNGTVMTQAQGQIGDRPLSSASR